MLPDSSMLQPAEVSQQQANVLGPAEIHKLRLLCKKDLFFFAKWCLGYTKLNKRIHGPLCELLQDPSNTRLRFILPRGWYKTTLISISYPIWCVINNANEQILIAQNTHTNAVSKLSSIDAHFRGNQLFRQLFPELLPTKDCTWTAEKMCVNRSGVFPEATFEAAGTRTKLVSRHYTKIIEDDTVAPDLDEMGTENIIPTKEDIGQAIGFHRLMSPQLSDVKKDQIIVVGTRWFEIDLLSWIEKEEVDKRTVPHKQVYRSYIRACRENELLGPVGTDRADENGTVQFPEEYDEEALRLHESGLGPYMFSCLYLNKPVRSSDMTFDPSWFDYYDKEPADLITYTTVDPGGDPKDTKGEPDWNVVMTCGKSMTTGIVYCLDFFREKCTPGELIDAYFDHLRRYRPQRAGIESVAYQKSLLYWIRERAKSENLHVPVDAITHGGRSKEARIRGLQPMIKAKMLLFRHHHQLIISEAVAFPYGKNDDLLDALAMQHSLWTLTRGLPKPKRETELQPGTFEYAKAQLEAVRKDSRPRTNPLTDLYVPKGVQPTGLTGLRGSNVRV